MTSTLTVPRSVEWREISIQILDQTKLPLETVFLELTTIQDVWEAITALKVRGAPAIGIAAAFGLALAAKNYQTDSIHTFTEQLTRDRDYLASSRPTAVNLFWAIDRVLASISSATTVNDAVATIINEALKIQQEDEQMCKQIGEYGLSLLKEGDNVLTICNAGSIATARYGTALAPFHLASERGIKLNVFASETRPLLQGARLTTWELIQSGVNVTLISDNMAAQTMATKQINAVIVGADRITANGDSANKIGTLGLAILAKYYHIPFYVAAPLSTFDTSLSTGKQIPIEERKEEEITHLAGTRIAPEGIEVYNPAFDVTPHELITGIITEKGIIQGNFHNEIKNLFI